MGKSTRRHPAEIRLSPLTLLCLFFVWIGVSGLAFYVGVLVGRTEQMREIRRVYRADESAVPTEEFPHLSFEEELPAPDEDEGTAGSDSVTKTGEAGSPAHASGERGDDGGALLQVASFRQPARAEHLVQDLRRKGYRSFQRTSGPSGEAGPFCRVFVGPLRSLERAEQVKEHLEKKEGYKGILVRPFRKEEEPF